MRAIAFLALLFGFLMPRILDGHPFDNTVFGIVCGCVSILTGLASKPVKGSGNAGHWEVRIMAAMGLVLVIFLSLQLPKARRVQSKFDDLRKEIQEKEKTRSNNQEIPQR